MAVGMAVGDHAVNALQPTSGEMVVMLISFVVLAAVVVALVDAVRRNDGFGALLLVWLGPLGLLVYLARRNSRAVAS